MTRNVARKRAAGFTLVEMLASVALVGLLAMTGVGLVASLTRVADEDVRASAISERRITDIRRLRAEVSRSIKATMQDGHLQLWSNEPSVQVAGWAYLASEWCVRDGVLAKVAVGSTQPCDPAAIRVRMLSHANVVELNLADYGSVVMRFGGGEP